jgi:hypothetical protein
MFMGLINLAYAVIVELMETVWYTFERTNV